MEKKIIVSVVIPAYNSKNTIQAAVDSALLQNVSLEVIIIDDCSTEDLSDVLSRYRDVPSVRIVRNEANLGVAASRNKGVSLARGEYIAFLDADDIWRKGKLTRQLRMMKKTGAVLSATARELMREDGTKTGKIISVPRKVTYQQLLRGNILNCSSIVLKKSVAQEFPMDNDDVHEDYICWLRILRKYGYAVALNEPYLLYRVAKTGKSGSKFHSARLTFQVYRRMGFGWIKSFGYFTCYVMNGIKKYFITNGVKNGR